ncbi:MAG: DinB family protein, partial [Anaerolineae bacterium]|nr:DinB family protein [Anaerolineae bacterium]
TGENSFIPAVDSDQWIHDRNYQLQSGPEALVEFVDSRIILLDRIEALNDEDWSQKCRHSILGPTTLQELLNISAQHDRKHIREIFQILKY